MPAIKIGVDMSLSSFARQWRPTDLGASLLFWGKADGTLTKNGDTPPKVSSYGDDSGNGHTFTESTDAEKPTWIDATYNGKPTLRGIGAACSLAAASPVSFGTAVSIFFALKKGSAANTYEMAGTSAQDAIISNFIAGKVEWFQDNGSDRQVLSTNASGLHVYGVTQTNGSSLKGYFDSVGTPVFSVTPNANLSDLKYLFGFANASGTNGDQPEIIVVSGVVSDSIRSQIMHYLGAKYGVAVTA